MDKIIDNWKDHPYLHILMYQYEPTRKIIDKIEKIIEKNKHLCANYVIGILGRELNNKLLEKYSVQEYLEGLYELCSWYQSNDYSKELDKYVIKKHWMSAKNAKKFYDLQKKP